MKAKNITAAVLAGIMALALAGCGDIEDSSKGKKSDSSSNTAAASSAAESSSITESSSAAESEEMGDSSSVAETESQPESSVPDVDSMSKADNKADEQVKLDISKIETFEDYDAIFGAEGDKAMELLINGIADGAQGEDDEGYLNAMSKRYNKKNINFDQGKDLLGCGDVYQMNIDFDSENGDIYTIAFRKNQDLNTLEGNTPDPFECKESYEALYKLFSERYGEPQQKFTPESNNFFGALWEDTPCGEIWIAWAEKIFGSEQCDCVVSFSKRGVNTAKS